MPGRLLLLMTPASTWPDWPPTLILHPLLLLLLMMSQMRILLLLILLLLFLSPILFPILPLILI